MYIYVFAYRNKNKSRNKRKKKRKRRRRLMTLKKKYLSNKNTFVMMKVRFSGLLCSVITYWNLLFFIWLVHMEDSL
jgi:hypothetical protein